MRRKTLWNGVKSIGPAKEKLEEAFEKAGGSTGTVSGIGAHCKAEHVDPECGYHDNR